MELLSPGDHTASAPWGRASFPQVERGQASSSSPCSGLLGLHVHLSCQGFHVIGLFLRFLLLTVFIGRFHFAC